jgi:hypothetical protein
MRIAQRTCGTLDPQEVKAAAGLHPKGRGARSAARDRRDRVEGDGAERSGERRAACLALWDRESVERVFHRRVYLLR